MLKKCSRCKFELDHSCFSINRSNKDGVHHYCRDCCRQDMAARRARNPRMVQRANLKANYNMSLEDWDALVEKQNGCCAICTNTMNPPVVDHSHDTGVVRGLLCHNCNRGIGLMGDSVENLKRAMEYLSGTSNRIY